MDLTKYYPDIVAKYPAYVTKRELCEICHICPKTAYNLEQQGEIPYTIEQNHLIRSHKIKLTDILAYLYRRECRQEADSPYICAMRTFYDEHLSPYSDLLSVKDIQQITGFSSSAIVRWISTGMMLPDLQISNSSEADQPLGRYGRMALEYLRENHPERFTTLKMDGSLMEIMHRVQDEATEKIEALTQQMLQQEPLPQTEDIMERTRHLNSLKLMAEETVLQSVVLIPR